MVERFSPELFRKVGQVRALFRARIEKFLAETLGSEESVRVLAGDKHSSIRVSQKAVNIGTSWSPPM